MRIAFAYDCVRLQLDQHSACFLDFCYHLTWTSGIFYFGGYVNPFIASPVVLGVVIGSLLGTRLLVKASNRAVRKLCIPVLLLLAFEMLMHGL